MNCVYHYTNTTGLLGINGFGSGGSMWMTNISYMNDHKEFDAGFEKIKGFINNLTKGTAASHFFGEDYFSRVRSKIYVASFTGKRDDLSQWRGYCGRGGYCIGFSENKLENLNNESGFKFRKCNYFEHETTIEHLKEKILNAFDKTNKKRSSNEAIRLEDLDFHLSVSDWICDEMPFLKDPAFSDENEFRLIKIRDYASSQDKGKYMYRAGSDYIVPYFNLGGNDFNCEESVVEIIVGPGPHQNRAVNSLTQFLLDMSERDGEVKKIPKISTSSIPLVSW